LSGRGLCDELITRPEESYRLCCVVVYDLETSRIGAPYIYDISNLRVNQNPSNTELITLCKYRVRAHHCWKCTQLENKPHLIQFNSIQFIPPNHTFTSSSTLHTTNFVLVFCQTCTDHLVCSSQEHGTRFPRWSQLICNVTSLKAVTTALCSLTFITQINDMLNQTDVGTVNASVRAMWSCKKQLGDWRVFTYGRYLLTRKSWRKCRVELYIKFPDG